MAYLQYLWDLFGVDQLNSIASLSPDKQKASYTFIADGESRFAWAGPQNLILNRYFAADPNSPPVPDLPRMLDFSSGIKSFELEVVFPEIVSSSGAAGRMYNLLGGLQSVDGNDIATVHIAAMGDGTYQTDVYINGVNSFSASNLDHEDLPSRIRFELNAGDQEVKVYFDNVEQTLLSNSYTAGRYPLVFLFEDASGNHVANAGLVASVKLITD